MGHVVKVTMRENMKDTSCSSHFVDDCIHFPQMFTNMVTGGSSSRKFSSKSMHVSSVINDCYVYTATGGIEIFLSW